MGLLASHGAEPGAAGDPVARWPGSTQIRPDPGRGNLVLFLHPRCPCSRATLAELGRLAAVVNGRAALHVLFLRPAGAPDGWERTGLWDTAEAIPGARVRADRDGEEAARFGAATSGHAMLFDRAGALRFSGGITPARGHEGDSPGRSALAGLLVRGEAADSCTAVFGCPLGSAGRPGGPGRE
jgi:hypothetical protein